MITRFRSKELSTLSDELPYPPPPPLPDSPQLTDLWDTPLPPCQPPSPKRHTHVHDWKWFAILFCEDHPFPIDCYPILQRDPILLLHLDYAIARQIYYSRFDEDVLVQCCMRLPTTEARICTAHILERVLQSNLPDEDWTDRVGCKDSNLISRIPSQVCALLLNYWRSQALL